MARYPTVGSEVKRRRFGEMCSVIDMATGEDCRYTCLYKRPYCWKHFSKLDKEGATEYVGDVLKELDVRHELNEVCLRGVDFATRRIEGGYFVSCDLRDVSFEGCEIEMVTFKACILGGVTFMGASIKNSWFEDCSMERANFYKARLVDTSFNRSYMSNLIMVEADWSGGSANGCELPNSSLTNATLNAAQFPRSSLRNSRLDYVQGHGAVFDRAVLIGTSFCGAHLENASFRGATLTDAAMNGAVCTEADFVGARLRGTHFESSDLSDAMFGDMALAFAYVNKARVNGIDLETVGLCQADVICIGGNVIVTREAPMEASPSPLVWLWDYPQFRTVGRLEVDGVPRGFEYVTALGVGIAFAVISELIGLASPTCAFFVGFLGVLFLFTARILRTENPLRRAALNRLIVSIFRNASLGDNDLQE